ncbi:hypothetical protein [Haloferax chudinovii]|uniref:Cell surface protein n=1 Tax=Haloferax chudinovii TaxID=1109010 RepID=A0ABD5XIT4_9EURY
MNLGQLGVGGVVLFIVVFALLSGGVNTPETPAPADDADRSIGVDVTEAGADDAPPEDPDPGIEAEPVIANDDGAADSGDDATGNESESESGTFETVETGDDDTDSTTRTTRPRGSPVGISNDDDGSSDDSSSDDSSDDASNDDSADDSNTDDNTDASTDNDSNTDDSNTDDTGSSSDDSTDDAGDETGDDSGDDIGMCTV